MFEELEQLAKANFSPHDGPSVLAVDLDGTILEYDGSFGEDEFGPRLKGMVEELQKIKDAGWQIVVWTCRPVTPKLKAHMKKNKVPYDFINEHPWNGKVDPRKIHARVYLDDKGLSFDGKRIKGLAEKVINFKPWWRREDAK
jgi:hypothetical protein